MVSGGPAEAPVVLLSRSAQAVILQAAALAERSRMEFGGSVVAVEAPGKPSIVIYAVPTGHAAEQGPAHVVTDADFQNQALAAISARYPGATYVGDWHIHPMYMPSLSSTDLATAREMLSQEHRGRSHLTLLLCTLGACGPELLGFEVRRSSRFGATATPLTVEVIDDGDPRITSALNDTLAPLEAMMASPPSSPPSEDADRVTRDLAEIERECGARVRLLAKDGLLGAEIRRGRSQALVFFPPEYPRGAPQVFSGGLGDGPLRPVSLPWAWSSLHPLHVPVQAALRSHARWQLLDQLSAHVSALASAPLTRMLDLLVDRPAPSKRRTP